MLYSVIVPIYNREKSIRKCIDSILNQTESDLELILVDDGSVDNSGKICNEYKNLDKRVVVIHKANGGVSSSRNAGMDIAQGKYIVFVDSDDYVDDTYLEAFNNKNTDLVITGAIFDKTKIKMNIISSFIELNENGIISFLKELYSLNVWGKRFDADIIKTNNLKFNKSFDFGEDTIFCSEYILCCKSFECIDIYTYHYCDIDPNSLSNINEETLIGKYALLQENMFNLFKDKPKVRDYLISRYIWSIENKFNEIAKKNIKNSQKKKLVDAILKTDYFKFCLNNCDKSNYSFLNMICYKFGLSNIILYRMKKHNEKREK